EGGFFMGALVHAEPEVMPPEFLARDAIKAQGQQRFLVLQVRSDEDPVALDHGRAGSPARQRHRPADVLGPAPPDWKVAAFGHAIRLWPSPTRPIGGRLLGGCPRCRMDEGYQKERGRLHEAS